ncbi:mitochondrial ribosomal protein S9 [Halictus rubicundus]|uniref:mitochondrial ribosomal protein S9 n=1 Tax=Halictus rubicundus TaxID=77578 RepID=UPI0040352429
MAVTMFTRFTNIRNVMNVNNISAVGGALSVKRHSDVRSKRYTTTFATEMEKLVVSEGQKPVKRLSKAMKIYLEKSKEYCALIERETIKYEIGKRHLANMMGEDPYEFKDSDIQRAIRYLFPSGIYDWRARPMMSHPTKIYGNRKEAQFDETGRPYHWLFYTCKPQYNQILYNVAEFLKNLNKKQDQMIEQTKLPSAEDKFNTLGSTWITQDELESKLLEELTTQDAI